MIPITFAELQKMSEKDLEGLISMCWKMDNLLLRDRCECKGIFDVKFIKKDNDEYDVTWEDIDGSGCLESVKLTDVIDKITSDGVWYFGLYRDPFNEWMHPGRASWNESNEIKSNG